MTPWYQIWLPILVGQVDVEIRTFPLNRVFFTVYFNLKPEITWTKIWCRRRGFQWIRPSQFVLIRKAKRSKLWAAEELFWSKSWLFLQSPISCLAFGNSNPFFALLHGGAECIQYKSRVPYVTTHTLLYTFMFFSLLTRRVIRSDVVRQVKKYIQMRVSCPTTLMAFRIEKLVYPRVMTNSGSKISKLQEKWKVKLWLTWLCWIHNNLCCREMLLLRLIRALSFQVLLQNYFFLVLELFRYFWWFNRSKFSFRRFIFLKFYGWFNFLPFIKAILNKPHKWLIVTSKSADNYNLISPNLFQYQQNKTKKMHIKPWTNQQKELWCSWLTKKEQLK